MGNPQVTDYEMGWLLGIIDGEGCFSMSKGSKGSYNVSIKLVNTCPIIIDTICHILTKLQLSFHVYDSHRTGNQKPAKRIEINGPKRVERALAIFCQYFFAKKFQADTMLEYVQKRLATPYGEMCNSYEQAICSVLKEAKK
jgi:hypothetical protein